MAHPTARYEPRQASRAALHRIVLDHLETCCAEAARARDGRGLPRFVEQEFREFLGCGVLARGFARFRCDDCGLNRLVPFSCKGRGFCPSCALRRRSGRPEQSRGVTPRPLVFLVLLLLMDSFKLVPFRAILAAIAVGAAAALAALGIEAWMLSAGLVPRWALSRYVGPLIEEPLEAVYIVLVLRQRRLGFLVDAAPIGFAVGTGFALVENPWYLRRYPDTRLVLSLVRGFGPAILHGALTATVAMVAKSLADRFPERGMVNLLPGLGAAIVLHSLFNQFALPPVLATCVMLVVLPVIMTAVFERSERATREWVGDGLDLDMDLLNLIMSPAFEQTRFGKYLRELREHFDGAEVSDMFCLLRLELELSIRAKGMLMAREAGLVVPRDPVVTAKLEELKYLQGSIGATGMLALKPLRISSDRDDWHAYLLEQAGLESRGHRWLRRLRALAAELGAVFRVRPKG